jgi:hypothetical protein
MKKYFMFVAVAAAGMLASCSSDSLTAGSDPTIEPTQEERVPIQLSVASPSVRATTRGTGTVGGVGGGANNWYGQTIKAFMFEKSSLTLATDGATPLYDDVAMYTPGTLVNIPATAPTNIGEAMLADGTIQYYPSSGSFDFFGYHVDNAASAGVDRSGTTWVIPFTIDGSQDLLSAKAAPLEWSELTVAQKGKFNDTEADYETYIAGDKLYSAAAARKLLQPVLSFNHLLSRLSFVVKAGDENAAGWEAGVQNPAKAVKVTAIQIKSKTTGKMAVAWTSEPENMITWDEGATPADLGAPAWLTLQERPILYEDLNNPGDRTKYKTQTEYDALSPAQQADYALTTDNVWANLVPLTPTMPTYDGTTFDEVEVGEALIVAPSTEDYEMKVTISQDVPTNWNTPLVLTTKTQTYDLVIPVPAAVLPATTPAFVANTSYKVILTVYGFERIQVTTKIIPWTVGADIPVGGDDD